MVEPTNDILKVLQYVVYVCGTDKIYGARFRSDSFYLASVKHQCQQPADIFWPTFVSIHC